MCGLHGATELGVIGGMWDTDTRRDEFMERYGIDEKEREMVCNTCSLPRHVVRNRFDRSAVFD